MSATRIECDSLWCTVVVGVRLTDGLYGTIVDRPSSPAILIYTRSETIFILCGAAFFAAWMAKGLVKYLILLRMDYIVGMCI